MIGATVSGCGGQAGKRPLIKHREFKPYHKGANSRMDQKLYHQRSLVEAVISVMKRKYGAAVRSREWWRQFREMVAMCLVYNLERAMRVGLILLACPRPAPLPGLLSLKQRISTELDSWIILSETVEGLRKRIK